MKCPRCEGIKLEEIMMDPIKGSISPHLFKCLDCGLLMLSREVLAGTIKN